MKLVRFFPTIWVGFMAGRPMLTFLLIVMLSSCSSWRFRQSQRLSDRSESRLTTLDSLKVRWQAGRQLLQLTAQDQQVWIWPTGEFRFSPDSGFIGSAAALHIQNTSQSVRQIEDSLIVTGTRIQALDSTELKNLRHQERITQIARSTDSASSWPSFLHRFWQKIKRVGLFLIVALAVCVGWRLRGR